MQRHRNIEIKCIIIANANNEKHRNQDRVILESDTGLFGTKFGSKHKPMDRDEQEL